MATIRRTQSPFNHHNGGGATSSPLLKHKPSFISVYLRRSLPGPRSFSLYRYLLFFSLGFILGLTPFSHLDNVQDLGTFNRSKDDFVTIRSVELVIDSHVDIPGPSKQERVHQMKELIIVTPTYNRAMQGYFLNRLGQVLRLVRPPLLWVVVEMNEASVETAGVIRKMGVMYRHLVCKENSTSVKDRGVHQRNVALEHIERHRLDGVVYFADDDNVYSLELFDRLREFRRFGTWPVAMLAHSKNKAILEGPLCNGSQVIGWHTNEKSKRLRRFHVDMSGFAFNSTILWDPKRWRRPTSNPIRQLDTVKEGFQETTFIEQLVEDEFQMEGSPPSCSRIMNWHLHLEGSKFVYPRGWLLPKNLDVVLPIV